MLAALAAAVLLAGPSITITDGAEKSIALLPEDTHGLLGRPLVKTRDRWKEKFGRDFLFLHKVKVDDGITLTGACEVGAGPLRLSIYEITKDDGKERQLRVVGTKWYAAGETARFTTPVKKHAEHVYIVTAEKTKDATELNSHLKYMSTQDDKVALEGFSTNFTLSTMKFKMAEKKKKKDGEFVKDADWLVGNLIDPQWVATIRLE